MQRCIAAYVHPCLRAYTRARTHAGTQARKHTHTHTHTHTHIHTYIHTYVRTYVRMYVRTYIHACTHTYMARHMNCALQLHLDLDAADLGGARRVWRERSIAARQQQRRTASALTVRPAVVVATAHAAATEQRRRRHSRTGDYDDDLACECARVEATALEGEGGEGRGDSGRQRSFALYLIRHLLVGVRARQRLQVRIELGNTLNKARNRLVVPTEPERRKLSQTTPVSPTKSATSTVPSAVGAVGRL